MLVAKRMLIALIAVVAVSCWVADSASAKTENFDSNPIGSGWVIEGETTSFGGDDNDFGYQTSQHAGGAAAGEMGGQITRRIKAYVGDDIGTIDPATTSLSASGMLMVPAARPGGFNLGFFNRSDEWTLYDGSNNPTGIAAGFDGLTAQMFNYRDDGRKERSGSLGAIAANTPTPFTLSWDHVAQSLTLAVDIADDSSAERSLGTGSVSYTWANGDSAAPAKDTFGTVNTFGVWPQAVTGGGHDAKFYLDDVTYTVPEPATATLLLLSILGMFAIRRRR